MYFQYFNDSQSFIVDATEVEVPAKYINHAVQLPNLRKKVRDGKLWLVAARNIYPYDQLFWNYGANALNTEWAHQTMVGITSMLIKKDNNYKYHTALNSVEYRKSKITLYL